MSVRQNPGPTAAPAFNLVPTQATVPSSSSVSLASATPKTVTSIALAAGTYLVWGLVDFTLGVATATEFRAGVSLSNNTLPPQPGGSGLGPDALIVLPIGVTLLSSTVVLGAGPTILTLAAPATLFLVAQVSFSLGAISAYGTLSAVQIA